MLIYILINYNNLIITNKNKILIYNNYNNNKINKIKI